MRIIVCVIFIVLSCIWCSVLAPEVFNAAYIIWNANEEIIVTKSKIVLDLFLLGFFGLIASILGLWISCDYRKK